MAYDGGWGGGGGGAEMVVWELSSQPEQRRKRHLEVSCSLQMHEEYFACHSILSSYAQN